MGMAWRKVARTYNIDARVVKELAKEKRPAAPRYKTEALAIQRRAASITDADRTAIPGLEHQPQTLIEERLKDVHIGSADVCNVEVDPRKGVITGRSLPIAREAPAEVNWYGFHEPTTVLPGRLRLSAVVYMLMDVKASNLKTSEEVAEKYGITTSEAREIQKYFGVFRVMYPEDQGLTPRQKVNAMGKLTPVVDDDLEKNRYNMHWVWPLEEGAEKAYLRGRYYVYKRMGVDFGDPDAAIAESNESERISKLRIQEGSTVVPDTRTIDEAFEREQRLTARELKQKELREQQRLALVEQEARQAGESLQPYKLVGQSKVSGSTRFARDSDVVQNRGSRYVEEKQR